MNQNGRHELKHNINYADMIELRSRLSAVMKPDANARDGNRYQVRSLYFDNYQDKVLREKIDGVNEREKFRLRIYNADTSLIRLEKKSKINGLCYKQSTVISMEMCQHVLRGNYEALKHTSDLLCLELYTKIQTKIFRPKNIVDYQREAYVLQAGNVRITLDHDIRHSIDIRRFLQPDLVTTPIPHTIILEVKYDHFLPELVRGVVSLSSRQQSAYSKYAITRTI